MQHLKVFCKIAALELSSVPMLKCAMTFEELP